MIAKKWQRKNNDWWTQQKVVTIEVVGNSNQQIMKGSVCTVSYKYNGLTLDSPPCPTCGMRISITRVPYRKLVLYDEVVESEHEEAYQRAKKEFAETKKGIGVYKYEREYLVLPCELGEDMSPLLNKLNAFGTF